MSIVKFNPFSDAVGFQSEMNRLFDDFFPARREGNGNTALWHPTVDVHEDEHSYLIDAELPGLKKEDVKVNFQDGVLTISGERKYENESKEKNAHRVERFYGKFSRTFNFPSTINGDGISASYDNGVLKITVPKAEEVKPRQIAVN